MGRARETAPNQCGQPSTSSASAAYTASGGAAVCAAKDRRIGALSAKSSPTGRRLRAMEYLLKVPVPVPVLCAGCGVRTEE